MHSFQELVLGDGGDETVQIQILRVVQKIHPFVLDFVVLDTVNVLRIHVYLFDACEVGLENNRFQLEVIERLVVFIVHNLHVVLDVVAEKQREIKRVLNTDFPARNTVANEGFCFTVVAGCVV